MYGYVVLTVVLAILYSLMIHLNNKAQEKKVSADEEEKP